MQTVPVLNDAAERERLGPAAFRGFSRLSALWGLTVPEQLDLLGGSVTRNTLRNWEQHGPRTLSADQLMRISFLLAIHEGLQRIWRRAPAEGDAWVRRARAEGPFFGLSPLEFMRRGGIPAMLQARAWIDGATGGPPSRAEYVVPRGEAR